MDLFLLVLLYNTNFLNKLKFNDLKKNCLYKFSIIYKINPLSAQSEERLVIGELSKRKRVLCISVYIINLWVGSVGDTDQCEML